MHKGARRTPANLPFLPSNREKDESPFRDHRRLGLVSEQQPHIESTLTRLVSTLTNITNVGGPPL
jgi:hypothetical protein